MQPNHAARYIGTLPNGPRMFRVPVVVRLNDSRACRTLATVRCEVLAESPRAAADLVRAEYAQRPETEIMAYGPKGGETRRFVGWESAIGAAMFAARGPVQLSLTLETCNAL